MLFFDVVVLFWDDWNFLAQIFNCWLISFKPLSHTRLCYSDQEQDTAYPRSRREDGQYRTAISVSMFPKTSDVLSNTVTSPEDPRGHHHPQLQPHPFHSCFGNDFSRCNDIMAAEPALIILWLLSEALTQSHSPRGDVIPAMEPIPAVIAKAPTQWLLQKTCFSHSYSRNPAVAPGNFNFCHDCSK